MAYLIKIVHRTCDNCIKHGYYSLTDTFTKNKGFSRVFESRIQAHNHAEIYKQVFAKDDVYIIDEENDIGTYFSTYKKKTTPKGILVKSMCFILLPILLPIVGIIMIKEKIFPPKYPNDFPQ
jgi:hypothetical protein